MEDDRAVLRLVCVGSCPEEGVLWSDRHVVVGTGHSTHSAKVLEDGIVVTEDGSSTKEFFRVMR